MKIEVSNGEVVDKYTILLIKSEQIKDPEKVQLVLAEAAILEPLVRELESRWPAVTPLLAQLLRVNSSLWDTEDKIRQKDNDRQFDWDFIELAKQVYRTNDARAHLKALINSCTESEIREVKSYVEYVK
jgi:hypothetical protein